MFTKALLLGLLSSLLMKQVSAVLKIDGVNLIDTHPDYIQKNESTISVHPDFNTISVLFKLMQPFPENVTFNVQMIELGEGDIMTHFDDYSVPICQVQHENRKLLPRYIKQLTNGGHCGRAGLYYCEKAGLFHFIIPSKIRNVAHPIINSNEIVDGDRVILKYDVVLKNFNGSSHNNNFEGASMPKPKRKKPMTPNNEQLQLAV